MHTNFEQADRERPDSDAEKLRSRAEECRRLAIGIADRQTVAALKALADDYERDAGRRARRGAVA